MKITKTRLKQLIKEELVLYEVELAAPIYQKLKAAGKLPPGATVKGADDKAAKPEQQQGAGQKSDFSTATGEPQTKKGERLCAQKPECYDDHLKDIVDKNKFSTRTGQPTAPLKKIYTLAVKKTGAGGSAGDGKPASAKDRLATWKKAKPAINFIQKTIMDNFQAAQKAGDQAKMQKAMDLHATLRKLHKAENFAKLIQMAKAGGWKETE